MTKPWKTNVSIFLKGWIGSILIALLIATSIKSAIADWNVVPTGSMKPTIVEGDRIFINKLAYDLKVPYTTWHLAQWDNPARGDIVVFFSPADEKRLVKRVIGLPGDSIAMSRNRLFINGKMMSYELVSPKNRDSSRSVEDSHRRILIENLEGRKHPMAVFPFSPSLNSFGPVTVPEGHYFMMGDNRDNSADSRFFGFVARDRIVGRANAIVISLDINDHYRPRWERFFTWLP
jgi:signal peptidase I